MSHMQLTNTDAFALRRFAAILVGIEAVALAGSAVVVGANAFTDDAATDVSGAMAVLGFVLAVPLALASRALWHGRGWPRGLVLTWQVLQIAAGVTLMEWSVVAGVAAIGVALACAALVVADARRDQAFDAPDDGVTDSDEPASTEQ